MPENRADQARSHNSLGLVFAGIGKRPEAEEQYRKALSIQEKLATDFPAVSGYRQTLAWSHDNLGNLLRNLGKRPEAEENCRKALSIKEKLAADFPAIPDYRQDLAVSHLNLGALLADLSQPAAAEEQYRKALSIGEKLADDFPAEPKHRQFLAQSHDNLGILLVSHGQRQAAEEQFREGLAIQKKLAADFPALPAYQILLGKNYCNYGTFILDGGKHAEGLEWFEKAIRTLKPIHDKEPRDLTAKEVMRTCYMNRAREYDWLQKFAEAVKDWDRAFELSPPAEQSQLRAVRAISRLQAGMGAKAVVEVDEMTKSSNWNADQWYDFACVYSVASGKIADKKAEYADRAMELLHKAIKVGYKNADHMKNDSDLDPLREREGFKKLMAELEKTDNNK